MKDGIQISSKSISSFNFEFRSHSCLCFFTLFSPLSILNFNPSTSTSASIMFRSVLPTLRTSVAARRTFTSTPLARESPIDSVKQAAEKANKVPGMWTRWLLSLIGLLEIRRFQTRSNRSGTDFSPTPFHLFLFAQSSRYVHSDTHL